LAAFGSADLFQSLQNPHGSPTVAVASNLSAALSHAVSSTVAAGSMQPGDDCRGTAAFVYDTSDKLTQARHFHFLKRELLGRDVTN